MTFWLLVGAVGTGLLSTVRPRSWPHWVLGTMSLAAMVVALVGLPSRQGRYWFIFMALVIAVGLTVFGALFYLLARRHPRRPHRHIIYSGYGLVFTVVALCWALAIRYPDHDTAAVVGTIAAYALGSLLIFLYKSVHTRTPARRT